MKGKIANHIGRYFSCLSLIFICVTACRNRGNLPLGNETDAKNYLQVPGTLFESGHLKEALHYVDSAFNTRSQHTVYEYVTYYDIQAYAKGIMEGPVVQLQYLDSAINLLRQYQADDPHMTDRLSAFLMSRGEIEFNVKKYTDAYNDFFEAVQLARNNQDVCRKMNVPYTIGMIMYRQKQFEGSGRYFMESFPYIDSCITNIPYQNNKKQEVLDNIGLCFTKLKKYDSAMLYYRQAFELVEKNPYTLAVDTANSLTRHFAAMGVILGNMAKVYLGKNQTDSAIALYKQAIELNAVRGHEVNDMQLCMIQLSDIYLSKGMLGPLKQNLQSLRACMDTVHSKEIEIEYQRLMYLYHEKNNEPAKAFSYLTNYLHKKDSAAEQQKQMLETDISKELKDKQQQFEIALLQKDNQINKTYLWVLIGFSGLIVTILILIFFLYRSSKKNVRQLTELNQLITGRRLEMEDALQQLEVANREKDRILRVVAHDLRNPIGGISSLSNIMLSGEKVSGEAKTYIETIAAASSSALGLILELLNTETGTISDGEKTMIDIGKLLQQVVRLVQFKAAEKQQKIELQLPHQPVVLLTHAAKMERVLNNLLVNAIKFSAAGAVTKVRLELNDKDVRFSIQDEGVGIAPEALAGIFDRFTSLKRTGTAGEQSFGLGLSICKQIVEAMGGRIWAESSIGKGTVFYVTLPVNR